MWQLTSNTLQCLLSFRNNGKHNPERCVEVNDLLLAWLIQSDCLPVIDRLCVCVCEAYVTIRGFTVALLMCVRVCVCARILCDTMLGVGIFFSLFAW